MIFHANEKTTESWGSSNCIRENKLQAKDKVRDKSLYNNKGVNPTRGNNICKYLGT